MHSFLMLVKSFGYAGQGILFAVRSQRNMQIHIAAAVVVFLAGWFLKLPLEEWRWIVLAVVLVWAAELINTAFEYLCDVVSPEFHSSVKRAKDIAAAAVLVCASGAAILGVLIFWPYFSN